MEAGSVVVEVQSAAADPDVSDMEAVGGRRQAVDG